MAKQRQKLSTPAPPEGPGTHEGLHRWGSLIAISLATLMMLMDFMAVSVALPEVRRSLGASFSEMQWVLEAFVLTLAAFVLTAGYVADLAGRRIVFLLGLAVLALGSLLGGLAPNPYVLIGGRVLQGLGGALLFATGPILLSETFGSGRWRAALAVWGTVTGLAVAFSPLVGGAIASYLGWRWIFLIDVPTCAVALLVGALSIREKEPVATGAGPGHGPDWKGLALFSAAIAILVIGLVRTTTTLSGWAANGVLACFACTALLLVAFIAVEAVSPAPMLDISLFRQRTFTGSSIAAFGLSAAVLGPILFLVLYLSYDLGYSVLAIGARLLLLTAMTLPFLPLAGVLDRFVPVKLLICGGLALVAAGFWLVSRHLTASSTAAELVPGLIVAGVGLELVNPRLASAAVAAVKPHLAAVASRTSSTFRQIGTATGVAVFGAVLATRLTDDLTGALSATSRRAGQGPQLATMVLDGQISKATSTPGAPAGMLGIIHRSFADSMHEVFLVAAVVAAASAVLALSVRSSDVPRTPISAGRRPGRSPEPLDNGPAPLPPRSDRVTVAPGTGEDFTRPGPDGPPQGGPAPGGDLESTAIESGPGQNDPVHTGAGQDMPAATGAVPASGGPRAVNPIIDLTQIQRHVRGQVTAASGEPLAGATVTLVHPNGDEVGHTIAAEDGSFDLDDIEEGTYTLVAAAPHYRPAARVIALRHGEARATVSLLGVGSLVVRVARARDGLPVDADLELLNADGGLAAQCRTGEDGVSILPDLLEGDYELVVQRDNYSPATGPVVVRRGRTGTAEVQLVGLGHLYGAVLDPAGGWVPGADVTLAETSGEVVAVTRTDGAGSYLFPTVTEGSYTISTGAGDAAVMVEIGAGTAALADLTLKVPHTPQEPERAGTATAPSSENEAEPVSVKKD